MKTPPLHRRLAFLLCFGLFCISVPATATDVYDFEIVIFERPTADAGEHWPPEPGQPDRSAAVGTWDALPASGRRLGPVAYTLKQKGMSVLVHRSWNQAPGRLGSKTWYWIDDGRLSGLLRVTRGRYIHIDTDLLLRDARSSVPYRAQLRRRMRSGELHYLDHPKIGILVRADRREAPPSSGPDATASEAEPKPVQPAAPSPQATPGATR